MFPRLNLSRHDRMWTPLFDGVSELRPLRVMIDARILDSAPLSWSPTMVLAGLLTNERVELYRYSDEGPPPTVPVMTAPFGGSSHAIGWLTAAPVVPGGFVTHELTWCDGETATSAAIAGNAVEVASNDDRTTAYAALTPADARARRTNDAVAAAACSELRADLFVTERPYLHAVNWSLSDGVTYCNPRDALSVVSLYLRTQGEFAVWRGTDGKGGLKFNKGLFYWVGTRALLPAGWRWFSACVAHDQHRGADDLTYLGGAVFQRVTRTLQARDDLLRAVNRRQNNDVAEDALTALDTCLVFLMGAIDATARIAHFVLGLPPADSYNAGWQKRQWLRDVTAAAPSLGAVVGPGTKAVDTLTVLRILRNTVHGAGLSALAVGQAGRRDETLVGLPVADAADILDAADRRGGRATWGLRELLPGRIHADPAALLERLLPLVLQLLDELMEATPVESLTGAVHTPASALPPAGPNQPFAERNRQSIRWQLGF